MKFANKEEKACYIATQINRLQPKEKESMLKVLLQLHDGKSIWEILKRDEVGRFLACNPKYIFEYGYYVITRFVKRMLCRLSRS